ncbi:MAG: cation-translocating P-type ATPase [Clostridia bacterium]|nr:cation-translocating P-type ATPase [Clostridia bacterium]
MKSFYNKSVSETLKELNTSQNGLTDEEAAKRLSENGENSLEHKKKTNYFLKFLAQFKDIMVLILIVAAIISLVFAIIENSSTELIDSIIIFVIVLINATLGFTQELKAENALDALRKMSQPYTTVIRNGEEKKVKTSELVVGDIVLLEAGDVVPADLLLLESASLKCDEASLTGESLPVEKTAGIVLEEKTSLGDRKNMCFSSTTVVYGRGEGVVVATGSNAEMGKIASMLSQEKKEVTPLQKSLAKLGEIITFIVLGIALVIFLVDLLFAGQGWMDSFLTAVAIAVAAIPESLPAVVTIILSIGVTKLAKKNTIIKKLHAVETLGCCQVICSDKTGTITQNKMTVREVFFNQTSYNGDPELNNFESNTLLKCMALCNDAKKQKDGYLGDPTEIALVQYAERFKFNKRSLESKFKRVGEIPFDSVRKLMTTVNLEDGKLVQYTKGAVDELLKLCTHISENGKVRKITVKDLDLIKEANKTMGAKALRVLAYATKELSPEMLVDDEVKTEQIKENSLTFIGLSGMIDPPREEVFDALIKCRQAGMKAIMITGDHKDTAYAIAKELGMVKSEKEVVNGSHLDKFTDEQLVKEINKFKVFTRVSPEHKVRIVKALQANGKVVAMTGDGVNDAPSIKTANIGIGMGNVGTEVTKDVADMILTDDNFATIVLAVEEGRKIFGNIQKTIQFLLGTNIAEVLSIFVITLLFPNLTLFTAVQILFTNLVTDTFPSIALGCNEAESDLMKQPPRDPKQYIIGGRVGFNIIYQGFTQAFIVLAVYLIGLYGFGSPDAATTMAFLTINIVQLFHMYSVRTNHSIFASNPFTNKLLNIAFVSELAIILLVSLVPPIAGLLSLTQLSLAQWLVIFGCSMAIVPIVEIVKLCQRKKDQRKAKAIVNVESNDEV